MLYFISEQTAWYNKQAKAIEATIHTCKMETPEGRYKYWLKKQMAFQKFNAITQLCFMLTGPSEATKAMSELIYLTSQIIDAEKDKSLQGMPKPEVHFFGGLMPAMLQQEESVVTLKKQIANSRNKIAKTGIIDPEETNKIKEALKSLSEKMHRRGPTIS